MPHIPALPRWSAVVLAAVAFSFLGTAAQAALPPVQAENRLTGTLDFFNYVGDGASYELYADSTSVRPGQDVRFYVNAPRRSRYRLEIFRAGWYGGKGARLVKCIPSCDGSHRGTVQPPPPAPDHDTGKVDAGWAPTDLLHVDSTWPSGYYVARVWSLKPAAERATAVTTFIVREPRSRRSDVLVVAPVNTWQAYNAWGGASLYEFNSQGHIRANRVSFNRPVGRDAFGYELQLVRFLESHDWDVSYVTDVDVDRRPRSLLRHRLVITAGHGEYWTGRERAAFDAARDRGVNLAFMGSNTGYWQVRYEDRRRTIVSYKNGVDPVKDSMLATVRFRDLGKPECELLGVQFNGGSQPAGSIPFDYSATAGILPWARGTGLNSESVLSRVVGYEFDSVTPGCHVPEPTVLFTLREGGNAQAVTYVARSGARVFASGSLEFAWGLDGGPQTVADPRLQAWMANYISAILRRRSPEANPPG